MLKITNFEDIKELSESNILFGNIILENLKVMRVKNLLISQQFGKIMMEKKIIVITCILLIKLALGK